VIDDAIDVVLRLRAAYLRAGLLKRAPPSQKRDTLSRILALLPKPRESCARACSAAARRTSRAAAAAAAAGATAAPTRAFTCACVRARTPCFYDCAPGCAAANPMNRAALASGYRTRLSDCAADHIGVVLSLTPPQLLARYPYACAERWGGAPTRHTHGGVGAPPGVPLAELMCDSEEACDNCGADGTSFFSFCLNRPVNADRVCHCRACGRCFYFRPGFLGGCCPYCACNPRGGASGDGGAEEEEEEEGLREGRSHAEVTRLEARLAEEGYWGY
jgi:hypothetical protein